MKLNLLVLLIAGSASLIIGSAPLFAQEKSEAVIKAVLSVQPIIETSSDKLWKLAEVSQQEVKSADFLATLLKEQGFKIISTGTAG